MLTMTSNLNVMTKAIVVSKLLIKYMLLCLLPVISVAAPDFPVAKFMQVDGVTPNTNQFGMNFNIRRFESRRSSDDVIAYYDQHWKGRAAITEYGVWSMIGINTGKKFYNVQVQNSSAGSWGYLSISDIPERLAKQDYRLPGDKKFPQMRGSNVVNDQINKDLGKSSRTILLTNNFSVSANGQYYLNHYLNKGWSVVADNKNSRMLSRVMTLQKGHQVMTMTISKIENLTSVVANIETANLLPMR